MCASRLWRICPEKIYEDLSVCLDPLISVLREQATFGVTGKDAREGETCLLPKA